MPRKIKRKITTREALISVWRKLVVDIDLDVSTEPETQGAVRDEDLQRHNVVRIPFNIEDWNFDENIDERPPVLLEPLAPEVLQMHPMRRETPIGLRWRSYIPPSTRDAHDLLQRWGISSCLQRVCNYMEIILTEPGRLELPYEESSLLAYSGLYMIVYPSPYLMFPGMDSCRRGVETWTSLLLLETGDDTGPPTCPHVTMMVQHDCNGREDSILYGELASLVSAMHARAEQPMLEDEEMERAFDEGPGSYRNKPLVFPREKRYPVLQLSFIGPQHARVLYACMDKDRIIICQSKIYSFETDEEAPSDLFLRIIASKPLTE
ncbi:hypothetical protein BO94DRAFT_575108 [Aspergillus sclerotioniger CBS 115572]|uniref:Uncharacterized protein n=1 Tax=Aspergillus sclerotioniger CBS 115572 TaxID=1450535 RepID=A0A317WNV1_9EURO|nr:hypothetical protein BO94DRAFT_575108 [Aspergillus sclerotioniger CBS 115572]PWY88063.1 hypothetical protein BO94DRAFT_575108 [Aspergillus sclerotioniger CBS 115572]